MDEYIKFIGGLARHSIFYKMIRRIIAEKGLKESSNILIDMKRLYIHDVLEYGIEISNHTLYDVIFGDISTLNEIYNETRCKHFKDANVGKDFRKSFIRKYAQKSSKHFLHSLSTHVCQYCETQLTYQFNIKNKTIMTADIDHIISQNDSTLLTMSYNNFVASCSTCNSKLKREKSYFFKSKEEIMVPEYLNLEIRISSLHKISVGAINDDDFNIILTNIGKSKSHLEDLKIIERINHFKPYLCKIINKYFLSRNIKSSYVMTVLDNDYNIGTMRNLLAFSELYDSFDTKDDISTLLKTAKHSIIHHLENLSFKTF